MSKGNGWVPIDKSLVDILSRLNRPFSAIEAMLSLTVDIDYGKQWTYRGYAKQWQWSVGKVKRFVDCSMNSSGTVVEQKGNGSGTLVHFIDKGLWALDEQSMNSSGTVVEQLPETTINPNPNPKKKTNGKSKKIPFLKIKPTYFTNDEWEELILHRRKKKATESERAYRNLVVEFDKAYSAGKTADSMLNAMTTGKGWAGFKFEWLQNLKEDTPHREVIDMSPEEVKKFNEHLARLQ